jgi:hypothetical protein
MNALIQTPYGDFEMSFEGEDLHYDDEGRGIPLICEGRHAIQEEVEKRFPQLPVEIQHYVIELPKDRQQRVTITAAHLTLKVWETMFFYDREAGNAQTYFTLAWLHPDHVSRIQFKVYRDYDQHTYFLQPDQPYTSIRALLEGVLKPSLHPILLVDEYMNHPDLLRK